MKIYGTVGHNSRNNRLDFGGNPDLDPDPGIFWTNFTTAILAIVKDSRREFDNGPKT